MSLLNLYVKGQIIIIIIMDLKCQDKTATQHIKTSAYAMITLLHPMATYYIHALHEKWIYTFFVIYIFNLLKVVTIPWCKACSANCTVFENSPKSLTIYSQSAANARPPAAPPNASLLSLPMASNGLALGVALSSLKPVPKCFNEKSQPPSFKNDAVHNKQIKGQTLGGSSPLAANTIWK